MVWTDREGRPRDVPEPPPRGSRYGEIGAFQGPEHYRRNAFTRGTAQEVEALVRLIGLRAGEVVLDVGCGTGRHVQSLRERRIDAVGVDVSRELLAGAPPGCVVAADARRLPLRDGAVDAVLSLCQGGFGLTPAGDAAALGEMCRVLRAGGRLALTAFALVFAARYLAPGDALDAGRGLHHQIAEVRGPDGRQERFDLWAAAYSVPHLRLLAAQAGLLVRAVYGVEPGSYGEHDVLLGSPELLLLAQKAGPG